MGKRYFKQIVTKTGKLYLYRQNGIYAKSIEGQRRSLYNEVVDQDIMIANIYSQNIRAPKLY